MKKVWQLSPAPSADFLASLPELSPAVAVLLWNRGLRSAAAVWAFLNDTIDDALAKNVAGDAGLRFFDPFLFRDMEKAVSLLINHIKKGGKIVVYGDYDADGVTASAVLSEGLRIMQANVDVYLPDRVSEGYGLNKPALEQIKEQGATLVITVDNGIRNKEEAAYARSLGLDIIITDHHVLPDSREDLPDCPVIDPADSQDTYPWPFLAGVGVSFKLLCALLEKSTLPDSQKKIIAERALDLVAVGTIADLVSLQGENRILVKRGLSVLNKGRRPGLRALFKAAKIALDKPLEAWNVGWQIGPRLNAASRVGHANSAFELVSTQDEKEAERLAQDLNQRNQERQRITEDIIFQVENQINKENLPPLIVGVAGPDQHWNEGVVGLVSGKICEKYHRPTLVISRVFEEGSNVYSFKGSGRSIEGFNLIAAISECADFLHKYGGHPMACGFSIENQEKLSLFIDKLSSLAAIRLDEESLRPRLKLDAAIDASELDFSLAEAVGKLAPFGQNNLQPRFASFGLVVEDFIFMGADRQHVKLRVAPPGGVSPSLWGVAFNAAAAFQDLVIGDYIDLAYYLDINEFNGRRDLQLKIIDWRPSEGDMPEIV